jgi:hypothetical protein
MLPLEDSAPKVTNASTFSSSTCKRAASHTLGGSSYFSSAQADGTPVGFTHSEMYVIVQDFILDHINGQFMLSY